ncbi:MAG: shikimate dehydrogenase [Peptococcaceae bacterium]|nr:shikimate dehydrogenase [Peptococcaceae bacterium]
MTESKGITGETQVLCVIGDPVAHSLSPYIHNAFVSACGNSGVTKNLGAAECLSAAERPGTAGLDYAYLAFSIAQGGLADFVRAAKTLNMRGFNVTMPHKEAIVSYMDVVSEEARRCGAVNTVAIREGVLHGYNTDGEGFVRALSRMGFDLKGKTALILGRGGAAKTIALTLTEHGMHVSMAARSRTLPAAVLEARVKGVLWEEIGREACSCDVLVNATPLGMQGSGGEQRDFEDFSFLGSLPGGALVVDLVYAPQRTQFLLQAEERGLRVMNGISHLVYQAALAFEIFTGAAPSDDCIEGVLRELSE